MGLDAVVYLRSANARDSRLLKDNHTDFLNETPAIHKRLGNASMIASIANEVLPLVGNDSVLFSRVLYSGSHSGDSVRLEELNRLESEIRVLRESPLGRSSELETFLEAMSDLIMRAREEGTPIVFV